MLHSDLCVLCRYVLWEAEDQGLLLPYACRMGCCTACAVRVKEGRMHQPQALGVSQELRDRGFALMCVGYPETDLVLETGVKAALMIDLHASLALRRLAWLHGALPAARQRVRSRDVLCLHGFVRRPCAARLLLTVHAVSPGVVLDADR